MRVKTSHAAAIVLAAVGVALAAGLLAGVAVTKATAADLARILEECACDLVDGARKRAA